MGEEPLKGQEFVDAWEALCNSQTVPEITIRSVPAAVLKPYGHYEVVETKLVNPVYIASCPTEDRVETIREIHGSYDADRSAHRYFNPVPACTPNVEPFFIMKLHRVRGDIGKEGMEIVTDGEVYWESTENFHDDRYDQTKELPKGTISVTPADQVGHHRYKRPESETWPGVDVVQDAIANFE